MKHKFQYIAWRWKPISIGSALIGLVILWFWKPEDTMFSYLMFGIGVSYLSIAFFSWTIRKFLQPIKLTKYQKLKKELNLP